MQWRNRAFFGCAMAVAAISLVLPAAAAATMATPVPTTTTIESSVTSSTYDSPVTFTARVSSSAGGASGWLNFIDVSNGTVLYAAPLSGSTSTFTTAALAPGTRRIVAQYYGDSASSPSSSTVLDIPVARESDAVAYQVDPAHDGDQVKGQLKVTSLAKKWSVTLGPVAVGSLSVSYPLIAGGRVFVTVPNKGPDSGSKLYALDAATGAVDWSASLGGAGTSNVAKSAYDGRRVFTITGDGVLTAFTARTGHQMWSKQLSDISTFTAPPTAYDGIIYVSRNGTLYAVSEGGGGIRWTAPVQGGDESSPAVDYTGAYVSYSGQQDYRFSLQGSVLWHHDPGGSGGGGSTAVLHGSSVYAQGYFDSPLILSKSSGSKTGTFASATTPGFDKTNMYALQNGNLVAVDPSGSPNRWTFRNGTLGTAPVVNGGVVYVGSSTGQVYGVSASSGAKLWTGTPTSPTAAGIGPMAVGGGLLVVPKGPALTAFGD